jgi:TonB family protein
MRGANATFRLFCGFFLLAGFSRSQAPVTEDSLVAKLDAAITEQGVLQATVALQANGAPASRYRDAFHESATAIASRELFGDFMQNRHLESSPMLTDAGHPELQLQIRIREEDFILPIERQHPLSLDLVPLMTPIATQPDGTLTLGPAGRIREEVHLAVPAYFISADSHLSAEREFARYQSEAKIDKGQLVVIRELHITQGSIASANRAELESFSKLVSEDQHHTFLLRRVRRADAIAWINSVSPEQANALGLRAYQQREYEAARLLYERAISAFPKDASAWNNLGRALAALDRLEEARKAYEQQIAVNPSDVYAYNNLGLLDEQLGHWDAAIESFRKQLEVHPEDPSAISNLPRALLTARRWEEAEEAASKAAQAQPNSAQHRLSRSIARVCQGKASNARDEIDGVLGQRPSIALLNNAAYFLTECDKENQLAESYANRAIALAETSLAASRSRTISAVFHAQSSLATYLDTQGWLLFKQGQTERALKILAASTILAPHAVPYAHLAQVEAKAGRKELAAQYWREATALEPGQLAHLPPDMAPLLNFISPISSDREWYPLLFDPLVSTALDVTDQPSYFFVIANGDGSVQSVRELDPDDQIAKKIRPAVRGIVFPAAQTDHGPIETVSIVRVGRDSAGKVVAARSVGPEALAIAAELSPAEFPVPTSASAGSASTGAYKIGPGISPPRVLRKLEPRYSEEARRSWLSGTVILFCVISADGKARDLRVIRSLGLGLDEQAIQSVEQWLFQPGTKEGQPVNVQVSIEVNFRLLPNPNQVSWRLARVEFHQPAGASRPTVEKAAAPHISGANGANATITFDINEHGSVAYPRIQSATDQEWGQDVIAALAKWKFAPALQGGVSTTASCTMVFERGN